MAQHPTPEELGEPAIKVAGFQLWVHGWQFVDAVDYDDANWLRVTAHCGAGGASVWTSGAILQTVDLAGWGTRCQALAEGQSEKAAVEPIEPELGIEVIRARQPGRYVMRVEITPDNLKQQHTFEFELDQSQLLEITLQCRAIAAQYPTRGLESRRGV